MVIRDDPEVAVMLMGIDLLDQLFTMGNILKINNISSTVFEDILGNEDVLELTGMESIYIEYLQDVLEFTGMEFTDIESLQDDLEMMFAQLVADVSELSEIDYDNMTEDDLDDIRNFMIEYGLIEETIDDVFEDATMISLGETVNLELTEDYVYYQFTAPSDGFYTIYTTGDVDPAMTVYDVNLNFIEFVDNNGSGLNFVFIYEFVAGETLNFQIEQYDSGMFSLSVVVPA
ncbi:hypothetical protein KHQ89_00090 [Mycoplasmatota bacterium]|nr:hypothetical protein KHQ89_00090 [Mycoplasmatota bacterium]